MPRKESISEEPKFKVLYDQCLTEIPSWRDVPRRKPKIPATPFYPSSFDELYEARKRIQSGELQLIREANLHDWYASRNEFFDHYASQDQRGFHPFKSNMRRDLEEQRVLVRDNPFHYQINEEDTAPHVMWYLPGVSRQEKARVLARLLYIDDLTPADFLVIRNRTDQRSVLDFPHYHVYTRIRPGSFGVLTPFPSLVKVSMAFAGIPGYTLERAFRHLN